MNIQIDGKSCEVADGETILDVAKRNGIRIPTLCFHDCVKEKPLSSCLVCLVKVGGRFVPACATKITEGMSVESETAEVRQVRKTALELLLSEHNGDCYGPCQLACPAHLDIPAMLRAVDAGDFIAAIQTIKQTIPLPAVLGRICPKPCEKVCRRKELDSSVEICYAKRIAADADLAKENPFLPPIAPPTGKSVAVLGAGPMGLSAAFYLAVWGHCVVLYGLGKPLGERLQDYGEAVLPKEILNKEIQTILRLPIKYKAEDELLDAARYDAIADCTESKRNKVPMVIRSIADGKEQAETIDRFLKTGVNEPPQPMFAVRRKNGGSQSLASVLAAENPVAPSRCLHCDCRGRNKCKLLNFAAEYQADEKHWEKITAGHCETLSHSALRFESEKCIKCGLCVVAAKDIGEEFGLAFLGRGFNVRIGVPFDEPLENALKKSLESEGAAVCEMCPTGAFTVSAV